MKNEEEHEYCDKVSRKAKKTLSEIENPRIETIK